MKKIIPVFLLVAGTVASAAVPRVFDVTMTQYGKCRIGYTLSEAPGIVTFDILTNGVSIGVQNLTNAVGDVNRLVQPGARTILWNADKIWPGHKFRTPCVTAKVTVWPTNAPPDWLAVDLTKADCPVTYYTSEAALPWGSIGGNQKYKGDVMLMRKVPASHVLSFMGSPETEANHLSDGRETRRMCTLTNDFYIGIYPMTFRQYYLLNDSTSTETRLTPVPNQSYNMLRYNVNNLATGVLPIDFPNTSRTQIGSLSELQAWRDKTGLVLDLPTSAQWEYACRAGTDTALYNGAYTSANLAAICDPNANVYEVGLHDANNWQLYDMIGNVFEWCLDYYEDGISSDSVTDPLGPVADSSIRRKIRGYHNISIYKRAAFVTAEVQNLQRGNISFRLCITLP